jgi:hypothetical protein
MSNRKLGKLAPKQNAKTLKLSKYTFALPQAPAKIYREYKIPEELWGMDANDLYGDCTCAAIAHMLMLITAHTGTMVVPTTQQVLQEYSDITGFNVGPPPINDNGAAITDVLNYWRTTGIAGHKILGWVQIDHTNIEVVKQAIWLFGAVDIGVMLPNSASTQTDNRQSWNIVKPDGGIDGGHSIPIFGYGADGCTSVTWGQLQQINWAWFNKYCDEAYAVLTEDWINQATQSAPNNFNLDQLKQDLAAL